MRVKLLVPLLIGCACLVESLPATSKRIDDSVEFVDPNYNFGDQPIIDTGAFDGPSFSNPFGGLFENLEVGGNSFPVPHLPGADNLDLGKGNTTSVTKVIDGHKVVINDTEYKKSDEFGESFFHFRVVDVQPDDTSTEKDAEGTASSTPRDTETVEDSLENEIPKGREIVRDGPEKLMTA
ncbi:unnamed protein product [Phaedon cochleariae]|uniref:Uncharacterized protein n=1 Tax=Phaedon cochleariae TaxID=80249 RepID=A0A9N9SK72_PHACE|nr:unnamed protein product [Phaedon cochleariae]